MAAMPERLAHLDPPLFQAQLRNVLQETFGCWQRAAGTSLSPDQWFGILSQAVQPEAQDWDDAVALSRFAFDDDLRGLATIWSQEVFGRPHVSEVLRAVQDALTAADVATPETANAFMRGIRQAFRSSQGLRGRYVMDAVRAALTGNTRGPCLGIVLALLGQTRTKRRIEESLSWIN